ncbi:unnamed protein product [Chrysoparadoxa australica]
MMAGELFNRDALRGRNVVVTGGAAGLGASISTALLEVGARVCVVGRNKDNYQLLQEEVRSAGLPLDRLCFARADLAEVEGAKQAVTEALRLLDDQVDALVNNAGIAELGPLESLAVDAWDRVMGVNVRAPFLLAQGLVPGMIERKKGKIINISSQAGTVAIQDHGAYCASKSALDSLTRVMTLEWSKHNIQCNSLGPTVIMTDMGKKNWGGEAGSGLLSKTPLGRCYWCHQPAHCWCNLQCQCSALPCSRQLAVPTLWR